MTPDETDSRVASRHRAPAFTLQGTDGGEAGEHSPTAYLDDDPVVLTFSLFDFHASCTEHMCSLRDLDWFEFAPSVRAAIPLGRTQFS